MVSKKEIPCEKLEREIIDFLLAMATHPGGACTKPGCNLKHGSACVLGTCHDNVPRTTPVDFFCDGSLTLWIAAEPGGKIANIMRNPNVSVSVYEKVNHDIEQKSMQLWGTAQLINLKNNPREFTKRLQSFGLADALEGILVDMFNRGVFPEDQRNDISEKVQKKFNLIKITPIKIILLHMRPGTTPEKKYWENGKAFLQIGLV